jgi:serine/threonine protein kinase/Tfp pilus assembly protein PilF
MIRETTETCPTRDELERFASGGCGDDRTQTHIESCDRCAAEIERIRADNDLLAQFVHANLDRLDAPTQASTTSAVPGYELQDEIHRGAQGVVYRAVQTTTKRPVAVKLLMQGVFATTRQRRRFEREVELVAGLRHPNIVTLFDSGRTADGGYFLAMELVEGRPLSEAFPADPNSLPDRRSIRARLVLFSKICEAVNAAHQRGIIHRDLKPANTLVDKSGEPRVLDFGLARRTDRAEDLDEAASTMAGEFLGTFAYAAPEQIRGDPDAIDIRCDVYALGVMLYESLTGRRPYRLRGSISEALQGLLDAEAASPRAHNPAIDDEVETIVLKALAPDPARRYQSAGALLDDIRHYLAGEPINAKRDSQWYVLRKTIRRYRVPLAIAGIFTMTVIGFAVRNDILRRRAVEAEQKTSIKERQSTETLTSFLAVLGNEILRRPVGLETIPRLFDEADGIVEKNLADQPDVAAKVRRTLGLARVDRGEYTEALREFEKALSLLRGLHGEADHPEVAEALHNCGRAYWHLGQYDKARDMYQLSLSMREALHDELNEQSVTTMSHLAATLRRQGRYADAEQRYRQVLNLRRQIHGAVDEQVAASMNNLGTCLRDERKFQEASDYYEQALAMIRTVSPQKHDRISLTMHNLAACLLGLKRFEAAESMLVEALALKRQMFEETHPSVAMTVQLEAELQLRRGDPVRSQELAAMALDSQLQRSGSELDMSDTLSVLGRALLEQDDAVAAEALLRRSLAIRAAQLPPNDWKLAESRSVLGDCLRRLGQYDQALPLLTEGHRALKELLGDDDDETRAAAARLDAAQTASR